MDGEEIDNLFEKHNDDFLNFDNIKDKRNPRKDICGFIYLNEKFGGENDIIVSAEHDIIWLNYSIDDLKNITEEDIIYINRCGISWDSDVESLCCFV